MQQSSLLLLFEKTPFPMMQPFSPSSYASLREKKRKTPSVSPSCILAMHAANSYFPMQNFLERFSPLYFVFCFSHCIRFVDIRFDGLFSTITMVCSRLRVDSRAFGGRSLYFVFEISNIAQ
jgi:hypothetical protein